MAEDKQFNENAGQDDAPAGPFDSIANSLGARNLMIIIFTMPVVFVAVLAAIIMVFGGPDKAEEAAAEPNVVRSTLVSENGGNINRTQTNNGQRAVLAIPAATGAVAGAINLPTGARAGSIALDGDRLAVRLDTRDGAAIVIYDLERNEVIRTVPLMRERRNARAPQTAPETILETTPQQALQLPAQQTSLEAQPGVILSTPITDEQYDIDETIGFEHLIAETVNGQKVAPTPRLGERRTRYVTDPQ